MSAPTPSSVKKPMPTKVAALGLLLLVAGVALFAAAYATDARHAAFNNIIAFLFLVSIGVGSIFLIALEYLAGAVWSVPMRRVVEFLAGVVVVALAAAVPLAKNLHEVFAWTHAPRFIGAADKLLAAKAPYLNEQFFLIRVAAFFGLWLLFYWLFTRNSLKQDVTRDQKHTKANVKLGAIFMPVFAITITFTAIDWAMSIEPHWFSTIFGVYYFSSTVVTALAAVTFTVVLMSEHGYLPNLRRDHYYSLGALMFAFTNFWAYIAFSQFMLIWYANLPEETFWFLMRWQNGWMWVSISLIVVRFAVPYFVLLPQEAKMDPRRLKFMAVWLLAAQLLDLYWLTMPSFAKGVTITWVELSAPLFVVGAAILVLQYKMRKHNLVPIGDPKLERAMEFHL